MGIRAQESDLDISGSKAMVTKIMQSNPRRVGEIQIEFDVVDRGLTPVQKEVLEKAAKSCPVALSLSDSLKQTVTFKYSSEAN